MTSRAAARAPAQRPREEAIAAGPRPYRQEAVGFADADANIRLADTLSIPEGAGPFPAAVLISGSGPQTRDEEVFGHKVFLVLADALNRRGIAVLRYDKLSADLAGVTDNECVLAITKRRSWTGSLRHVHGRTSRAGHTTRGSPSGRIRRHDPTLAELGFAAGWMRYA